MLIRKPMVFLVAQIVAHLIVISAYADGNSKKRFDALLSSVTIWQYDSLCEFKDSTNIPDSITYMKGSFVSTGCQDLEAKFKKPTAIAINLHNDSQAPLDVTVPLLKDVVCKSQNGTTYKAVALRKFDVIPGFGRTYVFLTEMTNNLKYTISPGKSYDVIFLFESAREGDMIYLGGSGPYEIKQEKR